MSETPIDEPDESDETVRQHAQDPAEGPDPSDDEDDVPRVHAQDPAEG